jgi:hypothetical protein
VSRTFLSSLAECSPRTQPITDFQLISYVDTTAADLVAVCGNCRRAAVVDVWAIIDAEGPNVWLGHIRERQQCQHCGARAAELYTRSRAMTY